MSRIIRALAKAHNVAVVISLLIVCQLANAQTDSEFTDILRKRVDVGKLNQSIVVGIIDEKGTRFTSYGKSAKTSDSGDSNEKTIFEIGSITKVFTGILLADAVKRGEVKLDDAVSKFLPKTLTIPQRKGKQITLLDLATHTSALPRMPSNFAPKDIQNPYADYSVKQMYAFLSKYKLANDIGSKYAYSNLGMGLLGHILALRAGMSYEELVKQRVLIPLGLKDTTITLSPSFKKRMAQGFDANGEATSVWDIPTFAGAGALRSTAEDMAKFVAANLHSESTGLGTTFGKAYSARRSAGAKMKIGLGWHILAGSQGDVVWHNGGTGGFRSFVGFNAKQKRAIVVLTNSTESVDDIGFHFLDEKMPLKKTAPVFDVSKKFLEEYVGTYELAPNVVFTITRKGGKLFAQLTGQQRFRVFAENNTKFFYKVVNAQLTFNRGTNGKVESLTLHQNGDRTAKKIK